MIPLRLRLLVAAAVFLGWLAWLGYAALAKHRGPVVSAAQAAAATHPVFAEVSAGPDGKPAAEVKVVTALTAAGPAADTQVFVVNLGEARGFDGPGEYLLMLVPSGAGMIAEGRDRPLFAVAGPQRSAGYEVGGGGSPAIYRRSPAIDAQARKLYP